MAGAHQMHGIHVHQTWPNETFFCGVTWNFVYDTPVETEEGLVGKIIAAAVCLNSRMSEIFHHVYEEMERPSSNPIFSITHSFRGSSDPWSRVAPIKACCKWGSTDSLNWGHQVAVVLDEWIWIWMMMNLLSSKILLYALRRASFFEVVEELFRTVQAAIGSEYTLYIPWWAL